LRKKSEAEKLQEEASGVNIHFIYSLIIFHSSSLLNERIKNPKSVMIQPKKIMMMNKHQRKNPKQQLQLELVNVNQRKICRNMMNKMKEKLKHQFQQKLQRKAKVMEDDDWCLIIPVFVFSLAAIDDEDVENEDDSPSKKTKGKPARKQGQKAKANPLEAENENGNADTSF
jgi:hypothetical protein